MGLRQIDCATRARVSRSFVSKLERGQFRSTDLGRVEAVCAGLGADLDVRVRWRGEGLDRLLDEGHAALVNGIVALLRAAGWVVALEVTFNEYGDRGSIDVFGWHPVTRDVLVVEVKSTVADAQGTLSPLDRKARHAPKLARARGWDVERVSRLLVVGEGPTNRRRVERFSVLFEAALPVRGWQVKRWLRAPANELSGLLFLSDAPAGSTRRTTAGRSRVRLSKMPAGRSHMSSRERE
jgi:transcriptional regulator with XRE-family HTH domain